MPLSISQFFDHLRESGVLAPDEVEALWGRVPKDKRSVEAERFAAKLVEASNLTSFQAESLLKGEGNRLVLGDYVLLEQIGAGGMGQVLKARHRRLKPLAKPFLMPGPFLSPSHFHSTSGRIWLECHHCCSIVL